MKKYLLSNFSFYDFQEMIANGDSSCNAQIRADNEGYIYLSQEYVGNKNLTGIKFRLPTVDGSYIGSIEKANSEYMKSFYKVIVENKDETGYIDPEFYL
ncbi:MAG: hypothetical protein IJC83_00980 [Oscillospiraceae bacterium]|nr:hypothetical protein [Oscillospiraceae bacterium]